MRLPKISWAMLSCTCGLWLACWGGLGTLHCGSAAHAEEVRYYEENGITYKETRRTIRRPISRTAVAARTNLEPWSGERLDEPRAAVPTTLSPTDFRGLPRTVKVPVTTYTWETRWRGRWNPFATPQPEYRLVPHTRWETRTDVVQTPPVLTLEEARAQADRSLGAAALRLPRPGLQEIPTNREELPLASVDDAPAVVEQQVVTRVEVPQPGRQNPSTPFASAPIVPRTPLSRVVPDRQTVDRWVRNGPIGSLGRVVEQVPRTFSRPQRIPVPPTMTANRGNSQRPAIRGSTRQATRPSRNDSWQANTQWRPSSEDLR